MGCILDLVTLKRHKLLQLALSLFSPIQNMHQQYTYQLQSAVFNWLYV